MRRLVTKVILRLAGVFVGLFGVELLVASALLAWFLVVHVPSKPVEMRVALDVLGLVAVCMGYIVLMLATCGYFIYAAYTIWFRFSPQAIRHVCRGLGLYAFVTITAAFKPLSKESSPAAWPAFLAALAAVYLIYKLVTWGLLRWTYPEGLAEPDAPPPTGEPAGSDDGATTS